MDGSGGQVSWFSHSLGRAVAWCPGLECERDGTTVEIDLGLFVGPWIAGGVSHSVIVECKSFIHPQGEEEAVSSIDRLRSLVPYFPTSRFLFATLARELSHPIRTRLRALSDEIPLVVLTGRELFDREHQSAPGGTPPANEDTLLAWAAETRRRYLDAETSGGPPLGG